MIITYPTNTVTIIDEIRGAIGREVDFYIIASSISCPVCDLDPITNTSMDSFCIVCSGIYWIPIYDIISISGHIIWGNADQLNWVTGGQLFDGDCRVQIKHTPENVTVVEDAIKVIVDGKTMKIKNKILRGVKELNRILIDLVEEEK